MLTQRCPQIEVLHLSSSNPFLGNAHLSDAGVRMLAARLPRMQQLNLQGSSTITDECIEDLARGLPRLEKLNLGGCFRLTDAAVRSLCRITSDHPAAVPEDEGAVQLTHLSLFQCTHLSDASVALLAQHMPTLQHLDVHSCSALTDASLQSVYSRRQVAPSTPLMPVPALAFHRPSASLDESEAFALIPPPSPAVTEMPFQLENLISLDIGSCRKITIDGVQLLKNQRPALLLTHY